MLGKVHVTEVECWRRGNDVRQKESDAQSTNDVFFLGGRLTSISVSKQPDGSKFVGAVISPATVGLSRVDLWMSALCVIHEPRVTLDDLLGGDYTLESAEFTGSGAKRRGRLSLASPTSGRLVITVDPSANYMIDKVESYHTSHHAGKKFEAKMVREVESFAEVAPGIFFPQKVKGSGGQNGRTDSTSVTTFSEVVVNQPIPASVFTLRFPPNVAVTDRIAGTTYQADVQGRPTSAVKKLGVYVPPSPPAPSEIILPTLEEPSQPWWPYALAVAGAGVCASAWWVKRYQTMRAGRDSESFRMNAK